MRKGASMIVICLVFVYFFAPRIVINAQTQSKTESRLDNDYSRFKSEFDKEFGLDSLSSINDTSSNINRVFFKTKIPDWILNLPISNDSVIYAIGISEPGMKKDSAYQLAILRAKAVLAIIIRSKIQWLTDYYTYEKDEHTAQTTISSVYKEFDKITSALSFNIDNFKIEHDTLTINNEAIVLVSLHLGRTSSGNLVSIDCLSEVSSSYPNKNDKYFSTSRTEMRAGEKYSLDGTGNYFYYIVKKHNRQYKVMSFFSGVPIPSNTNRMSYMSDDNFDETDEILSPSCFLQNGFWHAFSTALLQTIILGSESKSNLSSMDDQYTKLTQNLIRISGEKQVALKLVGLHVKNNILYLKTDFINQQH